jgi:protein-tyrosine phosphatase
MCWEVHPPLTVGRGRVIYGGNCTLPCVKDADIYVGLDASFRKTSDKDIAFVIPDGGAPADVDAFKALVAWVSDQLDLGRKVHVGCIAGHGRTGIVLAALVAHRGVSDDPIPFIRQRYCRAAVETRTQVDFLVAHFGFKPAPF